MVTSARSTILQHRRGIVTKVEDMDTTPLTGQPADLSDGDLAQRFIDYLMLNQQANVEHRPEWAKRTDEIAQTFAALGAAIDQRGKVWKTGLFGAVWLEDKPK